MPKDVRPVRIIACEVFKPFIEECRILERFPGVHVTFLPSNLHLYPAELRHSLLEEFKAAQKRRERVICLYGECFHNINLSCRHHGVYKIPGHHCYELLLGRERFSEIMEDNSRSYFLERELIMNFEKYCIKPLELHDAEMKRMFFRHYDRLVYISQQSDPDLIPAVRKISDFLGLTVSVRKADYAYLEKCLTEQLKLIFEEDDNEKERE